MTMPKTQPLRTLFLLTLLLAGITPLVLTASAAPDVDLGTNHALIIGIGGYSAFDKLEGAPRDAKAIAKLLTSKYNFSKQRVTLLTDDSKTKPTLVNIFTEMDRYKQTLTAKDNLLIFYSGHSVEDEDGETYWVPIDGKENAKRTWLSHADLAEEYFSAKDFKAKSLLILTDSLFSSKLVRTRMISLTPYDLRYGEKIREMAMRPSREVIAFGDRHWPASAQTDGLGLFAYYIRKALAENVSPIIDFENLLFEEKIIFPIGKIAGTRLIGGRLRTKMERGGQFVITKVEEAAIPNVLQAMAQPEKGYQGETFTFKAVTSDPADTVALLIQGKEVPMDGSGTEWQASLKLDELGTTAFEIRARNRNDQAGKQGRGQVTTIKKRAELANVASATVEPASGVQGERFAFRATTDTPAKSVQLVIGDRRLAMQGSDTEWRLTTELEEVGTLDYRVVATNVDGLEGESREGSVDLAAGRVDVVAVATTPESAYAGEEFTITAKTSLPAQSASVTIDGKSYPMKGKDKQWQFKTTVDEVGEKTFQVVARNQDNAPGEAGTGKLLAKRSPLPIPDVAQADVAVVPPGKGYAGDRFEIKATTSAASQTAYVEIDGQRFEMTGSGTNWRHEAAVEKVGESPYRVFAVNKDGAQGKSFAGTITTTRRPVAPVNVVAAQATPQTGVMTHEFSFTATTDRPAKRVLLVVGKKRYPMQGADKNWTLKRKIEETGDVEIAMVALNADNREGEPATTAIKVFRERFQLAANGQVKDLITGKTVDRFFDNGNGTITDRYTSLMWMREPKQIAVDFAGAEDYVRGLKVGDLGGWRLPTISEFGKLSDKKSQNPALPKGHPFANVLTHMTYWSKTKHKFALYMRTMDMWRGRPGQLKKTDNGIVWPVRYAPMQESKG